MKTHAEVTEAKAKGRKDIRDRNLSKDGKWRSFPKVLNLLQYVSTGTFYGRVTVDGKIYRLSLETTVYVHRFDLARTGFNAFAVARPSHPGIHGARVGHAVRHKSRPRANSETNGCAQADGSRTKRRGVQAAGGFSHAGRRQRAAHCVAVGGVLG